MLSNRPHSYVQPLDIRPRLERPPPQGLSVVNLSFNELPFAPAGPVANAIADASKRAHYYGDPSCRKLREALAQTYGLETERIICGNGSEELLDVIGRVFAREGDDILIPEYGYIQFAIVANRVGAVLRKAREANFTADVDAILAALTPRTKLVFIADPNNPTGTAIGPGGLRKLIDGLPAGVVLVIDLAYGEFAGNDFCAAVLELAAARNNLIVTRTFSKAFGLAGLRVGWCYAPEWMLPALNAARAMGPVNALAQAAALAALGDVETVTSRVDLIVAERDRVASELRAAGYYVAASRANFLLCGLGEESTAENIAAAERMANYLFDEGGFLVNQTREAGLRQFIRFSLSTEDNNSRLIECLQHFQSRV